MCDILGLNANKPTRMLYSAIGFYDRDAGKHPHGWGIAWYPDQDGPLARDGKHGVSILKEPQPMYSSVRGEAILEYDYEETPPSRNVILHARTATGTAHTYANTHPFTQSFQGIPFTMAHNGWIHDHEFRPAKGPYAPIGETDSERLFCYWLNRIAAIVGDRDWLDIDPLGRICIMHEALLDVAPRDGSSHINTVLTDGEVMFVHSRYTDKDIQFVQRRPGDPIGAWEATKANLGSEAKASNQWAVLALTGGAATGGEAWETLYFGSSLGAVNGRIAWMSRNQSPQRDVRVFKAPREYSEDATLIVGWELTDRYRPPHGYSWPDFGKVLSSEALNHSDISARFSQGRIEPVHHGEAVMANKKARARMGLTGDGPWAIPVTEAWRQFEE